MATGHDIVGGALRLISSYSPGEGIDGAESDNALTVLNRMLKAWGAEGLIKPFRTLEAFPLTPGTPSYSIGSGQTWNTTRPDEVTGGFVRDASGIDHPVRVIPGSGEYNAISDKDQTGTPKAIFYDPQYPYGVVYVFPTGNSGQSLYLESRKPFNQFSSLNTSLSLPDEYEEHVIYQLAKRLAPEYGTSLSAEARDTMQQAEERVVRMRARPIESCIDPAVSGPGGQYNIESDSFA